MTERARAMPFEIHRQREPRAALCLVAILTAACAAAACGTAANPATEHASKVQSALGDDGLDGGVTGIDCGTNTDHPTQLACTGLYSDWPSRTIAAGNVAFDPGLHLWSDGADKSRWVYLPPGTQIDTTNMNEWTFPVGTKFWKEFRLGGRRVETRFLSKSAFGWFLTTYQWSDDESAAVEVTNGVLNVRGTGYEIPSQNACTICHMGRLDDVLGFEVVGLSSPAASGLTMAELVRQGLVTSAPASPVVIPGNATESAALGWLHANCGNACHNRSSNSLAGSTGLWMRLEVANLGSVGATDTYTTAVNVPSNFQPFDGAGLLRVTPGSDAQSAIPFRDGTRDDQGQGFQMPPIDTHIVDTAGVAAVRAWINAMPPSSP